VFSSSDGGRLLGYARVSTDEGAKVRAAKKLAADKSTTIDDVCDTLKISRSTYYRYVAMKSDAPPDRVA